MATLIFEHSDSSGSGRLGEVLRDHGHRLRVVRLHRGDPVPVDLDGVHAVVTCGGSQSPLDDETPWIADEMDLLARAHAAALPCLGLCLGSQVLGRALGGEVGALDGAIEAGWHEVRLTPGGREDPLFAGIAWWSTQLHWHRYHVVKPPEGGRILASSARTPVQAWGLGLRTYGIQYHPEAFTEHLEAWADEEPAVLEEMGITLDDLHEQTKAHHPTARRLADRLFETIAIALMPLDRRFAGAANELRHVSSP
jgi:GMP synthase-like glutamine amidotransferase